MLILRQARKLYFKKIKNPVCIFLKLEIYKSRRVWSDKFLSEKLPPAQCILGFFFTLPFLELSAYFLRQDTGQGYFYINDIIVFFFFFLKAEGHYFIHLIGKIEVVLVWNFNLRSKTTRRIWRFTDMNHVFSLPSRTLP